MNIVDTNGINHIFKKSISLHEDYCISPDIKDESEVTQLIFGATLPRNIKEVISESYFDEALYIDNYKYMLNKYRGRSFFNMTGFGDISILALVKTIDSFFDNQPQGSLFIEKISVFTDDMPLRKKLGDEFKTQVQNTKITILGTSDIK